MTRSDGHPPRRSCTNAFTSQAVSLCHTGCAPSIKTVGARNGPSLRSSDPFAVSEHHTCKSEASQFAGASPKNFLPAPTVPPCMTSAFNVRPLPHRLPCASQHNFLHQAASHTHPGTWTANLQVRSRRHKRRDHRSRRRLLCRTRWSVTNPALTAGAAVWLTAAAPLVPASGAPRRRGCGEGGGGEAAWEPWRRGSSDGRGGDDNETAFAKTLLPVGLEPTTYGS